MAFDAGMLRAVAFELNLLLGEENGTGGSKVEKIYMPDRDEIHLMMRVQGTTHRLVVSASPSCARALVSTQVKENPANPPMLCMLLRKRLTGARISAVRQKGFERVLEIEFDTKDEMGFSGKKCLIAEIMGKHSNIIFCDYDYKILGAVRTVDLTSTLSRRIIAGMKYELPPAQDKLDPTEVLKDEFCARVNSFEPSSLAEKVIVSSFFGISPLVAREMVFRASGDISASVGTVDVEKLYGEFAKYFDALKTSVYSPALLFLKGKDTAFEYTIYPITQYESSAVSVPCESVSQLVDEYFSRRDRSDRIKQRSQDISRVLTNAQNRLIRKIEAQKNELIQTGDMEKCRLYGDLITQEMYRIKKGDPFVIATDYSKEEWEEVRVELDTKLTPSQNAQSYYKKYNRKKSAVVNLETQIEISEKELLYIDTVFDALSRAVSEKDLSEIREELSEWGYIKKSGGKLRLSEKKQAPKPMSLRSPSGYEVLVGKNNLQNDYITTKMSEKNDWWFHVKNYAGSHVLMKVGRDEDPPAEDFTFACEVAAQNSSANGENVAVDYTQIKYIKKPAASKPGFVTYTTYWTAFVTPKKKTP